MLILLPASDAKHPVASGPPVDGDALSFPGLASTRAAVRDALIEVSTQPDAPRRLSEAASRIDEIRGNLELLDAPAGSVSSLYAGVLYDALALDDLPAAARRRAQTWVVIVSALWGALRPSDAIPPYRLNMCGRLPGLEHLPVVWRPALDAVLPTAAGRGVVVDFRSSDYATAWRPTGALAERTIIVKVVRDLDGRRGAPGHNAKRTRGLVARRILTDAIDPTHPEGLAELLSAHFDVEIHQTNRLGRSWELAVCS